MAIQLNIPRDDYKPFPGRNTEQMPRLIAEGRAPLSTAGLMKARLAAIGTPIESDWCGNYFDLGDAIAYGTDGTFHIVTNAPVLRSITPQSPLQNGALIITPDEYNALGGTKFRRDKAGPLNDWISKRQVVNHPVWRALAGEDSKLLQAYADIVFKNHEKAMGVFVSNVPAVPSVRAWYVYYLDYRSNATDNNDLDGNNGRLVGVAPEAQSCEKNFGSTLDQKVAEAIAPFLANAPVVTNPNGRTYILADATFRK